MTILKVLGVLLGVSSAIGLPTYCSHDTALTSFKRPTYDFSVRILDRVSQQTWGHFVFSPISTWLQLLTLAEGARGPTEREIWRVTRYHKMKCFRRKYREVLNSMDKELNDMTRRTSTIVLNSLLDVKKGFTDAIMKDKDTKVLSINFNEPEEAVNKVNGWIDEQMNGVIDEGVYVDDFNFTVLLMVDTAYFKSDWLYPFNQAYTTSEYFYDNNVEIGKVNLMTQDGYFNVTNVPALNASVLELPFKSQRVSMLVVLPNKGQNVKDIFYSFKDIRLMTIFSLFNKEGPKLVTVRLPRFKVNTQVNNLVELIHDMGVKKVFYPDLADLSGISDYRLYASLMTQVADIEINEKGARANSSADFLIQTRGGITEFNANCPFAYLIVDRVTEIILFAGIYSDPNGV
ncbi:unnamed protein product [Leptidea sinapis]|uniref:Serpin domain-containing protein n=1 Tax=Leptidea sinapis TaxID=189913 RepID=A0A5E4QE97_9NEOP|nr:unnamed protein product [Leptidea sinapis]